MEPVAETLIYPKKQNQWTEAMAVAFIMTTRQNYAKFIQKDLKYVESPYSSIKIIKKQ